MTDTVAVHGIRQYRSDWRTTDEVSAAAIKMGMRNRSTTKAEAIECLFFGDNCSTGNADGLGKLAVARLESGFEQELPLRLAARRTHAGVAPTKTPGLGTHPSALRRQQEHRFDRPTDLISLCVPRLDRPLSDRAFHDLVLAVSGRALRPYGCTYSTAGETSTSSSWCVGTLRALDDNLHACPSSRRAAWRGPQPEIRTA